MVKINGKETCEQCPITRGPAEIKEIGCSALSVFTRRARRTQVARCALAAELAPKKSADKPEADKNKAPWQPLKRRRPYI